jgi:hypothetical protein
MVSGRINAAVDNGSFLELKCADYNDRIQLVPDVIAHFDTNNIGTACPPNYVS